MKQILIRSGVVGAAVGLVAAIGLYISLASGPPAVDELPWVARAIFATIVGGIAFVVAGGITFAFGKFPRAARVGAVIGTIACVVLSGMFIYSDWQETKEIHWSGLLVLWLLIWPLGFGVSLWVDVKHTIAKRVVEGLRRKP